MKSPYNFLLCQSPMSPLLSSLDEGKSAKKQCYAAFGMLFMNTGGFLYGFSGTNHCSRPSEGGYRKDFSKVSHSK
jgi:hypothetical protein